MYKNSKKGLSKKKVLERVLPNETKDGLAKEIFFRLKKEYPDAKCELNYHTPFQLLISTILSAQCTDIQVNKVTATLFKCYPNAEALSKAHISEIEQIIKAIGLYHNKAKNIVNCARKIVEEYNQEVPQTMEELVILPGVGRKTANVVLSNGWGINVGVVVDTHVSRVSQRLSITTENSPVKIEIDLMKVFPHDKFDWCLLSHLLIFHGRRCCTARAPKCVICVLLDLCPWGKKNLKKQL